MMNTDQEIPRLEQKRQLSKFMCQEMYYDYVTDRLSQNRVKAMEDFLEKSEDSREELESFQFAVQYCEDLSEADISGELIEELKSHHGIFKNWRLYTRWSKLPPAVRWSAEGFLISSFVALVAMAIPWEKVGWIKTQNNPVENNVTIAEIDAMAEKALKEYEKQKQQETGEQEAALSTATTEHIKTVSNSGKVESLTTAKAAAVEPVIEDEIENNEVSLEKQENAAINEEASDELEINASKAQKKVAVIKSNLNGSLTRIYQTYSPPPDKKEELLEFLKTIGAKKAGKVQLGWNKNESTRYYHMVLTDESYQSLVTRLKSYAPVRIITTPHGRVMPEGKVRLILEVNEKE